MIEEMYYDAFKNTCVLELDLNAPPERYIPLFRGENGMYIEAWTVNSDYIEVWMVNNDIDLRMNIAFNEDQYYDDYWHNAIVQDMCERNHCTLSKLRYVVMSEHEFDEYVKHYINGKENL